MEERPLGAQRRRDHPDHPRLRELRWDRLVACVLRAGTPRRTTRSGSWTPPGIAGSRPSTPPTRTAAGAARASSASGFATKGAERARPDRDRDEDVQPDGRRRGSRPRSGSHPPPDRHEPAAPRRRAGRPLPGPRLRPGHAAGGDAAGVRRLRRARARSARSAPRTSAPSNSRRRSRSRCSRGCRATSGCRTASRSSSRATRRPSSRSVREHGLGYTPFSPLAGGWLTGKYRRDEAPPAGSRMTLRPEPYAGYTSDRVFDALEELERQAADAEACRWPASRLRGLLSPSRADGASSSAPAAPITWRPPSRRSTIDLSPTERDNLTEVFS